MRPTRKLAAAALLALFTAADGSPAQTSQKAVVGYLFPQGADLRAAHIDVQELTRINYAFANIVNGRVVQGSSTDDANFAYLNRLRSQNPKLTILISIGGWLWSTHFSDVALTAESRAVFIQSAVQFVSKNGLDGVDLDWEYPGMAGAGHPFRAEDKQNFTLLLKELRAGLDAETAKRQRRLYLTIAAAASEEFLAHTEMAKAQAYLDTVNLMAYDYYEPGSDQITGNQAPLFADPADPRQASADATVQAYEKAGVPAGKIVLGVPFYGHAWSGVPDRNHGLFQRGKAAAEPDIGYQKIVTSMLNHGYLRYWDAASRAPSLYNAATQSFVSYEDPASLAAKCHYVKSKQLGGVMFWHYDNDPSGELLKTVHDALGAGDPAPRR